MPKTQMDQPGQGKAAAPPPLTANIRRHIGLTLRSLYAGTLTEPVGERIDELLQRLGKSQR